MVGLPAFSHQMRCGPPRRLDRAADLRCYRANCLPLRSMILAMLQHHPDRSLPHLRRIPNRCLPLFPCSILLKSWSLPDPQRGSNRLQCPQPDDQPRRAKLRQDQVKRPQGNRITPQKSSCNNAPLIWSPDLVMVPEPETPTTAISTSSATRSNRTAEPASPIGVRSHPNRLFLRGSLAS